MIRTQDHNTSRASIEINMEPTLDKKESHKSSIEMLGPLKDINALDLAEDKNHKSQNKIEYRAAKPLNMNDLMLF